MIPKRTRSLEDRDEEPKKSRTDAVSITRSRRTSLVDAKVASPISNYVTHVLEQDEATNPFMGLTEVAWNSVTQPIKNPVEEGPTPVSVAQFIDLSESSIDQMVKVAQEATRLSNEQARQKQQEEEDRRKFNAEMKRKKIQTNKQKIRDLQKLQQLKALEPPSKDGNLSVEKRTELKSQVVFF